MKSLRQAVRDYLVLRRGLGFKLKKHEPVLGEFVAFLAQKKAAHITTELALQWATHNQHQRPAEWAARLSVVRAFVRHWSGPRLHDFRRPFAVETRVRWYRQNQDPMRLLPVLATDLGHGHVTDTDWYLTNTPELLTAAGQRLENRWKGLS